MKDAVSIWKLYGQIREGHSSNPEAIRMHLLGGVETRLMPNPCHPILMMMRDES